MSANLPASIVPSSPSKPTAKALSLVLAMIASMGV